MKKNIHLFIIDPQVDFCDPDGALYVSGAEKDMSRLAALVNRVGDSIDAITVTLDSHHPIDIAHPIFWRDSSGAHPGPFTIITADDVKSGRYTTTHPGMMARATKYTNQLQANGRYPLCIWPPHCLIGSGGHAIVPELFTALRGWEERRLRMLNPVTKGSNYWTEHYSAVQADVPDPEDPGTALNWDLIRALQSADTILIAGEALSHCVANTIRDVADNFGPENVKKFCLLEDCSSNVAGFEHLGDAFVRDLTAQGMGVARSTDYLP